MLASVFTVRRRVSRWNTDKIAIAIVTAAAAYFLMGVMPQQTPDSYWFVMLCGAIAICAMILPGISGAFLLVLLGKYQHLLDAVAELDLLTLGVFVVGAAGGLLLFARLLRQLLIHQRDRTIAALIGLMLGSVAKIWPWKEPVNEADLEGIEEIVKMQGSNVLPDAFTLEVGLAIALAVFGFGMVLFLEHLAERQSK